MTVDAELGRVLADIVEEAGTVIMPLWRTGLTVDRKADFSPVTEADRQGEALILARLGERFPGVPVISEEDASEFGTPDLIAGAFGASLPSTSRANSPMPPSVPINWVASTGNRMVLALGEVANIPIASTYFCAMK